jgi:hypothetical protein
MEATMQFTLPQYEMRCSNEKDWVSISEKTALENLFVNFDCVAQVIDTLLKGKEIIFEDSVYRMRKP